MKSKYTKLNLLRLLLCSSLIMGAAKVNAQALAVSISGQVNVSCNGSSNGSATANATGGNPSYTYLWSPGNQTTDTATGLSAGTYTVTVIDASADTATDTVTITQPNPLVFPTLCIPITLTNNTGTATSANFQQMITVNSSNYSTYESAGLQNIEFSTGASGTGTVLQAWIESGATNASTATVYWVNLGSGTIPANGSLTIYMNFAQSNILSASGPTGEAPQISGTYGQYDNGALVFSYYTNFAGSSLPGNWVHSNQNYTVSNGLKLTNASSGAGYIGYNVSTALPIIMDTYMSSWMSGSTGGSYGEAWWGAGNGFGNPVTGTYASLFLPNSASTTNGWNFVSGGGSISVSTPPTGMVTEAYTVDSSSLSYNYVEKQSITYSMTSPIVFGGQRQFRAPAGIWQIQYMRLRVFPPGGTTMPAIAFGTITPAVIFNGCSGANNGTASYIPTGGTTPYTYLWSPVSQTTSTATGLSPGTYTVTATDNHGCTNSASISIASPSALTVTANTTSSLVCAGSNVTLTGGGASTYTWDNSVTNGVAFAASATHTYTVTGTDVNGCSATAIVTVTVNSLPTVTANTTSSAVCAGSNVTLTGGGASSYIWDNSVTDGVAFAPSSTHTYTVTGTDGNNCSSTDTVTVTVNSPPSITGTTPASVCDSGIANLSAAASSGTINWYADSTGGSSLGTGASFATPEISSTIIYYVDATDNGCTSTRTAVTAAVNASPVATVTASGATTFCEGGSVTLSAGTDNYALLFTGGTQRAILPFISPETNYTYELSFKTSDPNSGFSSVRQGDWANNSDRMLYLSGGNINHYIWSSEDISSSGQNYADNQWHHAAVVVESGVGQFLYVDGILVASGSKDASNLTEDSVIEIGATQDWTTNAAIDNVRLWNVVKSQTEIQQLMNTDITGTPAGLIGNWKFNEGTGTITINSVDSIAGTLESGASWIDDNTNTYAWSTGETTQGITVSSTGSYSVTVTNSGCSATSAPTSVTVNAAPSITSTTPASLCDSGTVSLGATTSAGTINWYADSTGGSSQGTGTSFTTRSISATTTYYVDATSNGCTTSSRTAVTATVNALPVASITTSGPTGFCGSNGITLYSTAGASYLWSTGETTSSIYTDTTNAYSVTVTDSNGCSATSSGIGTVSYPIYAISIQSQPANINYCASSGTIAEYSVASSNGTSYQWQEDDGTGFVNMTEGFPRENTQTATLWLLYPDSYGMDGHHYRCIVYGAPCTIADTSKSALLTVIQPASFSEQVSSETACGTGSNVQFSGISSDPNATYRWVYYSSDSGWVNITNQGYYSGSATSTLIISNVQSFMNDNAYYVYATDSNGCTNDDAGSLTVDSVPTVNANTTSSTICAGNGVTLAGSGAVSYSWNNSVADGVEFAPSATHTYTVTGTDSHTCSATATVTVTVNSLPTVNANTTSSAVCTGSNVTLTGGGASSYTWDNSVTDGVSFTPDSTLTYTVTGTDGNSCSSTATVTVTVNSLPTVTANTTSNTVCAGSNVTLTGSGASIYSWDNSVTDGVAFTPDSTLAYTVTGTDGNSCSSTATVTVTVNSLPTVTANTTSNTVCAETNVTLTGGGASTYSWDNSVTDGITFTPDSTLAYTVTGTDGNSCSSTATVTVTVNSLPIVTANTTSDSVCTGSNVTLTGGGALSYIWNNGITDGVTFAPSATHIYTVTGTDTHSCSATATVTVTVNSIPVVTLSSFNDVGVCNSAFALSGGSPSGGIYSGTGVSNGSFSPSAGVGVHTITYSYTDTLGCSSSATAGINVTPLPRITSVTPAKRCDAGMVTLEASATVDSLNWYATSTGGVSLGTGTSFTTPFLSADTVYYVAANYNGCVSSRPAVRVFVNFSSTYNANMSICYDQSVTIGTTTFSTPGLHTVILTNAGGCDSTVNVTLAVNYPSSNSQTVMLCAGQTITVVCHTYSTSGNYTDVFTGLGGCDSTIITHLRVNPAITSSQVITLCPGQTITVGSNTYSKSGVYTDVFISTGGCDSTVTTYLAIDANLNGSQTVTLCAGEKLTVGNNTYSTSGIYRNLLSSYGGCDSTITTYLTVNPVINVTTSIIGNAITTNSVFDSYQWINCNNGNAIIPGATSQSYSPMANGDYAVIVTLNTCSDTSACISMLTTGLDPSNDGSNNPISVYPNPNDGVFNIKATGEIVYSIINELGQVVRNGILNNANNYTMNVQELSSGIYYLIGHTDKTNSVQKVVVNK